MEAEIYLEIVAAVTAVCLIEPGPIEYVVRVLAKLVGFYVCVSVKVPDLRPVVSRSSRTCRVVIAIVDPCADDDVMPENNVVCILDLTIGGNLYACLLYTSDAADE